MCVLILVSVLVLVRYAKELQLCESFSYAKELQITLRLQLSLLLKYVAYTTLCVSSH